MNRSFTSRVARKLNQRVHDGQFSGAVLIRRGGTDLFCRASGYANRTWKVKNTTETRFRIASVGKLFTAAAVMQLIEAGELSLDTRVVDYLGLTGTKIPAEVTVYHLLTMTSGIADWINEEAEDFDAEWSQFCRDHPLYLLRRDADYLPIFSRLEPYGPPGEKFRYSNSSFILLGLMIEKAAGLSYFDYVRQHIFAPAGMIHTDFLDLDDVQPGVADGYVPVRNPEEAVTSCRKNIYSTTAGAAGDGGGTSTLNDLACFMLALRQGKLFSRQLVESMLTTKAEAPQEGPGRTYGFGCFVVLDDRGQTIRWGHTGEEDGVSCRVFYYPMYDVDLVVLGNQSSCAGRVALDMDEVIRAQA